MANDCLVTKLKSTVNNSNLSKLGSFKLKTKSGASISIGSDVPISYRSIENDSVNVTTSSFSSGNYNIPVGTTIEVLNKYKVTAFNFTKVEADLSECLSYTNIGLIRIISVPSSKPFYTEDLATIQGKINSMTLYYSNLEGNINDLIPVLDSGITTLNVAGNLDLTGSIDTIVTTFTSLSSITITETKITVSRSVYDAVIQAGKDFTCSQSQIIEGQ